MKPLSRPPKFDFARHVDKLLPLLDTSDMRSFISLANSEYYHWEELRHRPLPLGLTSEEAWTAVKFARISRHQLPLRDADGNPFSYWLPDAATRILHEVDRQGGGVLAAEVDSPSVFRQMQERVLIDALMEEAIATSQIEGAVTTRKVAKELLRTGRQPRDRSEQMIANGYRTIRLIRERLDRPLTVELLHEIQESMTRDTLDHPEDAGRFRTPDDQVFIVDGRDNDVVFTPPPADQLNKRMERLIQFANQPPTAEPFIHPLIRASVLHFWLAYEHPYVDGNGRTARALFYWLMLKSGYWLFEFLTISRIIHAAPMKYYRSFLHSEHDDNDLTYFLMFQFEVTRKALADLHKRLHELGAEQQRIQALRLARGLNPRQRAILDHALRHPGQIYTFESHQASHGITYQTARTDLLALADRGLLLDRGSRRPREFHPAPHLQRKLGLKRRK
jgi:Fic family protein